MVVKKLRRPMAAAVPADKTSQSRFEQSRFELANSHSVPADSAAGPAASAPASMPPAVGPVVEPRADVFDISFIMPTTSFLGPFAPCGRRILEILAATNVAAEFGVALDGQEPSVPSWLDHPNVTVVMTGVRSGPAAARNAAAQEARGRILFFVDGDVRLDDGVIERVLRAFDSDPDLAAMFGAYDDEPAVVGVVSQFRNLLHHHTHVVHTGAVDTFWSGCGAVRAPVFLDIGGFDETITLPSIEDIDIGMRITEAGGRIDLDPGLRCKHLKRWTLWSMIVTDVFQRAVPWTKLILSSRRLPATLSIDWHSRVSGVFAVIGMAALAACWLVPQAGWVAVGAAAVVILLNRHFYMLCMRKHGPLFAVAAIALHFLYYFYSSITFGIVALPRLFHGGRSGRAGLSSARPAAVPAGLGGMSPQH